MPVTPAVAVHGGAWNIPEHLVEASKLGCRDAAAVAYRLLRKGGSCVDAVTAAVACLEDDPNYDAGRGSVLNERREIEMHAMVMRGDTCDVGACVSLNTIRNPVKAARIVLEKSHHCILNREGATKMARKYDVDEEEMEYFLTDHAKKEFDEMADYQNTLLDLFNSRTKGHDTVGAVAIDAEGNVACATSTGGITRQIVGRISDSCLVGSGGFADNEIGAISTTGHGESIMKVNLARLIGFNLEKGLTPFDASREALAHMKRRVGGCGGAIVVDPTGNVDVCFNTDKMSYAIIQGEAEKENGTVPCRYGVDLTNVTEQLIEVTMPPVPLAASLSIHKSAIGSRFNLNGKRTHSPALHLRQSSPSSTSSSSPEPSPSTAIVEVKKKKRIVKS